MIACVALLRRFSYAWPSCSPCSPHLYGPYNFRQVSATEEATTPRGFRSSLTSARPLFLASAALAIIFSAFALLQYVDDTATAYNGRVNTRGDFAFLLGSGRLITSEHRGLLYEPSPAGANAWPREHGYMFPSWFPYPPAVALGTALFHPFDLDTSLDIWRFLIAVSAFTLGACVASAFKSWPWRIAMIVAVFLWFPLLMNVRIGQTGAFVAAATALFTLAYLRKREAGAMLLGLLCLKPTAAIGPALIVLQERPAIWLRFAITGAAVVILPFALLGPGAFFDWLEVLRGRTWIDIGGGHSYNQGLSSLIGASTAAGLAIAAVLCLIAAGLVHLVQIKLGLHAAMAFAILGGSLVNPHSLFYDWGTAFVAIMLLRMSDLIPQSQADKSDLLFGLLGLSLFFCGQFAWDARHEEGQYLRPLTAWTLLVAGALFLLTIRRFTEPEEPSHLLSAEAT